MTSGTAVGGAIAAEPARALAAVRAEVATGSERLYALMAPGHPRTLRIVAVGGSVYGTAADVLGTGFAAGHAPSGSTTLRRSLGNGTLVPFASDRLSVVDPLFA